MTDLVLIPGLGADERQFEPQRAAFPQLRVPAWLTPLPRESLRDYAVRLGAAARIEPHTVVAGVSFGGMVALEIARAFRCRAAVLIGSCRHPRAITPVLRPVARYAHLVPEWCVLAALPLAVPLLPLVEPIERRHARLLVTMAQATGPSFIKWGGRAIFEWEGCADPGVPVHHIHGRADRIIPAARVHADTLVAGFGHVLNLTAPVEVNRFLSGVLESGPPR